MTAILGMHGARRARLTSSLCLTILALVLFGCAAPRERADEPHPVVVGSTDTDGEQGPRDEFARPTPTPGREVAEQPKHPQPKQEQPEQDQAKLGNMELYAYRDMERGARDASAAKIAEKRRSVIIASSAARLSDTSQARSAPIATIMAERGPSQRSRLMHGLPVSPAPEFHTEQYDYVAETGFREVAQAPLSTFSIDVDTASYSNVRRLLADGSLPPAGAVRVEELINYFDYDYPEPSGRDPFSITTELATAPWNPDHQLLMVGLRGRSISAERVPARNLVFLIDVSGSMTSPDKLPLVKTGLRKLARELRDEDRVSIVVYAGAGGVVLEPTSGRNRERIDDALERLHSGGSTNGAGGIRLAYETARRHFDADAVNRVILATDGDFNVGTTSRDELVRLIEKERESGIYLTVLGVGTGNLKDATMEQLADHGNGNYAYLDNPAEARKVLIEEAGSTLVTIAKDVKIQVEFNPAAVAGYRLIGYENRRLADRDFNDDTKDAGEIGAGHTVTALYEVVPAGKSLPGPEIDPLRYGTDKKSDAPQPKKKRASAHADELATVKLRYKQAGVGEAARTSELITRRIDRRERSIDDASSNLRFAAAVAAFGMVLTDSDHRGDAGFSMASRLAKGALGPDPRAYRSEFLRLVAIADGLSPRASLE